MFHFNLPSALNQYFLVGCKTFTRHELLAYGGMDYPRVENCLLAWEARGFIKLLKPLDKAEDAEITAHMLAPIGEFDLLEDSVFGLVDHSPEPVVVDEEELLAYLTCDLPLGYPFDDSISQLLLVQIRTHHRHELWHQQYKFLTLADQFISSHPWLSYLAARKHEAVMAVMPGDSDDTSHGIARECALKSKSLRSLSRLELDQFIAHDCERIVALQAEALRVSVAKASVKAALADGFSSLGRSVPPPLPVAVGPPLELILLLVAVGLGSIGLGMVGGLTVGIVTCAIGLAWTVFHAVHVSRSRRCRLAVAQTALAAWQKQDHHVRACRDSLHLVAALIGLTRVEALDDLTRTAERLSALDTERCELEARYVAPYGAPSVQWRPRYIQVSPPEPVRYQPDSQPKIPRFPSLTL